MLNSYLRTKYELTIFSFPIKLRQTLRKVRLSEVRTLDFRNMTQRVAILHVLFKTEPQASSSNDGSNKIHILDDISIGTSKKTFTC